MERDIAKIATLIVFGAILVDVGTNANGFASISKAIGDIFTKSLQIISGKG